MAHRIRSDSQDSAISTRSERPARRRSSRVRAVGFLCALTFLVALGCDKAPTQGPGGGPAGKKKATVQDLAKAFPSSLPRLVASAPDDTILLVALQDMDRADEMRTTALGESWNDPNLSVWRDQSWPKIKRTFQERTGADLDEVRRVLSGDAVFFVALAPPATPDGKPTGYAACLWRPEREIEAAEAFLRKALVPDASRALLQREGDLLAMCGGDDAQRRMTEILDRYKAFKSVSEGSFAARFLRGSDPKALAYLWAEAAKAVTLVDQSIEKDEDDASDGDTTAETARNVVRALGFDNIDYVSMSAGFRDKGFVLSSRLQCAGPRRGVWALVGSNAPMKALNLVPATANNVSAARLAPVSQILATVRSAIESVGPLSQMALAQWNQYQVLAASFMGLQDFETEFSALFGQEIGFTMDVGGMMMGVSASLMIEAGDKDKLMTVVRKIVQSAGATPTPATYEEVPYEFLMIPNLPLPFQLTYGMVGDFFVLSTQQTGFRQAVQANKTGVNLASSEELKRSLAHLDASEGFSMSYSKPSPSVGAMTPMLAAMAIPKINQALGADFTPADVPNLQIFLDRQEPTISISWAEDDALAAQSYTTGLSVGFDPTSLPVLGMATAIAVPGFVNARTQSQARACQEAQQKIQGATQEYMLENNKTTAAWDDLVGEGKYLRRTPKCPYNNAPIRIPGPDENAVCPNGIPEHAIDF
ncbi:hypothetical protein JW916_13540 [Candidatus Sumerlaeota bacterium]|nr:hypothetical protein [Candidatus Sumerlaeota bacterium]